MRTPLEVLGDLHHDPGITEARLQGMVLRRFDDLQAAGFRVLAWRANAGMLRNDYGQPVRLGRPGQADVMALVAGRFFGIELKAAGKDATAKQAAWGQLLTRAGGIYYVAHTLNEVFEPILRQLWGTR